MDVDCGSKICHTEFKILPTCHLYVPTPDSNCSIPCILETCNVEIYHNIRCPVILCHEKTTTTSIPTTISPTPTPPDCSGPLCYTSLSVNAFLAVVILLGFVAGAKYIKKLKQRHAYQPLANDMPIIRGFSNVDLNARNSIANENSEDIEAANAANPNSAQADPNQDSENQASILSRFRSLFRFSFRSSHQENQIV